MKAKRILMVTMSMGIGGAETHIAELCRRLTAEGYEISVASNGGVYVDELLQMGVRHHLLPLHNKNIFNILKSFFALRRIIKRDRIEVVHAHARIPALIAYLACASCGVPMVTTAHGTYSAHGLLRHITRWGHKTLAVSEDIAYYLTHEYSVKQDNITVTVNGIDTEKFSPAPPDLELARELLINMSVPRLLCLGRLDVDSGQYAFSLLNNFEAFDRRIPGCQVVIVGGGPQLPQARAIAREINKRFGENRVVLTGPRTDIPKLLNLSSCVIALSRAALEAMACEKPVVLGGFYGYFGLFTPKKLDACMQNNFTARGFDHESAEVLLRDCAAAVEMSKEELLSLIRFGRRTVEEHYSSQRMAKDAISVYSSLPALKRSKKRYDFVLLGYYGYSNSGDDALLASILSNLRGRSPDLSVCVLSNRVKACREEFLCHAVHRFNFPSVIMALRRSRVLVFGGGNLIQDITSAKSLFYYTSILWLAQRMGLYTMLYSNGIGPITRPFGLRMARSVLQNVDVITLREKSSLDFLSSIGVTKPRRVLTADETLTLDPPEKESSERLLLKEGIDIKKPYFCVSIREWPPAPAGFYDILASELDEIAEKHGLFPVLLALHAGSDEEICRYVASKMKSPSRVVSDEYGARELTGIIGSGRMLIGMRLHALIYSVAAGVPCIGLIYDEKVSAFLNSAEIDSSMTLSELRPRCLSEMANGIILNELSIRAKITERKNALRELALQNSAIAIELLSKARGDI